MNLALSPKLSRALALTILVALLSFMYSGLVQPLLDHYADARGTREQLESALLRARQTGRTLSELQAELARLKGHGVSGAGTMQSPNESLAAAELQNRIKSSVEAARGELRSTQILPSREEGAFQRISIRGQIAVNLEALQRIFYELESTSPLLFLDNVDIRVRPMRQPNEVATDNPILDVRFDLYGYVRRTT
jgi:general secretion pathway protein M